MKLSPRLEHLRNYTFLVRNFRNSRQLIDSLRGGRDALHATDWSGVRLVHPEGRGGLAGTLVELWIERCYTRDGFYEPAAGDTIVDAGAHIGLFSIWVARQNPMCQVVALEPCHENYSCLASNLAAAGLPNIQAHRVAVGGDYGAGSVRSFTDRSIDHRFTANGTAASPAASVPCVPLEGLLEIADVDRVALLKMDIEGSEHEAFKRATPSLLRRFERIAMEYHDNLVSGTLDLLRERLSRTHNVEVLPTGDRGYGILRARLR
jgi:FkbM family methyltransferase